MGNPNNEVEVSVEPKQKKNDNNISYKQLAMKRPVLTGFIFVFAVLMFIGILGMATQCYISSLRHQEIIMYGWPPVDTNVRALNESSTSNDNKYKENKK